MTCGEFGLPIIDKNVLENGFKWTCLPWGFQRLHSNLPNLTTVRVEF
jgi:hypothetical protein